MLLHFLSLLVVYIVSMSHYSTGKAVLITIFIGVATFVMYFIFNMLGIFILGTPSMVISELKPKTGNDKTEHWMKSMKKASTGAYDWRLPFNAVISVFLAAFIFNLFHASTFLRALFYLTFAFYAVLSYLDKVFTHMGRRFFASALEASIYFLVSMALFHVT